MSDIEKLCSTFSELQVDHTRRKNGEYEYVFIGECRNIYNYGWNFKTTDLDSLLRGYDYFEFKNGKLVSYSNSYLPVIRTNNRITRGRHGKR